MKIVDHCPATKVTMCPSTFEGLKVGDVFTYGGKLYLRVKDQTKIGVTYNALDLIDYLHVSFANECKGITLYPEATLVKGESLR